MIAQGVDFIFLPPREEKPLIPAVMNAKKAGIPVLTWSTATSTLRSPNPVSTSSPLSARISCGRKRQRVADWTIKQTGDKGKIIELEGSVGASPANDRKKGFDETIKAKAPGMVILASQSGDFARDKGRQVAETLLQAHPDATIVYAHNDEMALGAIAAIEAAGKVPGKDILVVSIDGEKDAIQAIVDGKLGCSCECNPRFGPLAFKILYDYAAGEKIPPMIINPDNFYDTTNAKEAINEWPNVAGCICKCDDATCKKTCPNRCP